MINLAVRHLASQLNQYLRRAFDLSEDVVVISNLLEQDGSVAPNVNNKVVMFLTNIEKDSTPYRQSALSGIGGLRTSSSSPALYLNLYVMVVANFSGNNYPEALKFISNSISFFQKQPLFDHQTSPDLDHRIEKLMLDIENLKIQDLSNLWGLLSGKYLPSILYKVRMVTFDAEDVIDLVPSLTEPAVSVNR